MTISSREIRQAIEEPVREIVEVVKTTLEKTPPELAADLVDRGITIAGGGALLRGLVERIQNETEIPVQQAQDPLSCVALGTIKYFDYISGGKLHTDSL